MKRAIALTVLVVTWPLVWAVRLWDDLQQAINDDVWED